MDDFDLIETPENVELERRLAGIGSRFLAGTIDLAVIVAIWIVIIVVFFLALWATRFDYSRLTQEAQSWVVAAVLIVAFLMYWGYFVFAEMLTNGRSPGKVVIRIRVVKQDGGPITFLDVAVRNILRVIDGLPGIVYLVGGITMFCTKRSQRLGDLAAGTVVVMEQVADYASRPGRGAVTSWQREASPEALRATGLRPEEFRVLMNFWLRRSQLTMEAQRRLLPRILLPVLRRIGQAPTDESMDALLQCLDALVHKAEAAEGGEPLGPAPSPEEPAP